ncbi:NAD(+)/NADH kinase [Natrononativus amylolyticus]|uniref:NAD(+)/NADH kinase n=1 Tax=Natrononativus amylolyticus TaxID=2963434 RepID=UPI0020CEBDA3|nr:NAD(+)/NADH kinase [Natrononativus amylolyticus]
MERGAWAAGDDPVVGIVPATGGSTDGVDLEGLESAVAGAGASSSVGESVAAVDVAPDVLVTVGEAALTSAVREGTDAPILPIGSIRGIGAVAPEDGPAAIRSLLSRGATECRRPLLTAETDAGAARALFDVALVTAEPATISEYGVDARSRRVSRFRADGVVVATPAGSRGYADAAGGPQLSADVRAVAVVPIAPFVMQTRHWVLPDDRLSLSVERDEGDVVLCADDRTVGDVDPGSSVSVGATETLSTLVVPESSREFV